MSKETEIKAEIAEYKELLNDSTVPQDEKDFAKEEIKDLEAQLAKLGKKEPKKATPKKTKKSKVKMLEYTVTGGGLAGPHKYTASSKADAIKQAQLSLKSVFGSVPKSRFKVKLAGDFPENKKPKKEKLVSTYKGKKFTDLDEKDCEELLADIKARRAKALDSSAKSKSKPVIDKVAANVATAVKQAIDNVPAADIDKAKIEKFKKLEVAAKNFMAEMKSILGEDYDKESVQDEFKQITDLIEALRKKYTK